MTGPESGLDRLWAGWRSSYLDEAGTKTGDEPCVFCRLLASDEPGERTYVVRRGEHCAVLLNAYPYTSGHLLVLPLRHVAELEEMEGDEGAELWGTVTAGVRALKAAYQPGGINIGANLGRPAGAGIPGHVHVHVLPRWSGDTNFLTSVAEARVLPEALQITYERVQAAWPAD